MTERQVTSMHRLDLSHHGHQDKIECMPPLKRYRKLKVLNLSGNKITKIEHLEDVPLLEELYLARNIIRRVVGLRSLKNLARLDLSSNFIVELPHEMASLKLLSWLQLGNNKLADVKAIQILNECPALSVLNLSGNPLCGTRHYRATILRMLSSTKLDNLDQQPISPAEMQSCSHDQQDRPNSAQLPLLSRHDDSILQAQKITKLQHEIATIKSGNAKKEEFYENEISKLRSELEATTQLLVRKTAEWAQAEENASRLQQELAFFKIDHPTRMAMASQQRHVAFEGGQGLLEPGAPVASSVSFDAMAGLSVFSKYNLASESAIQFLLANPETSLQSLEEDICALANDTKSRLEGLVEQFKQHDQTRQALWKTLQLSRDKLSDATRVYNEAKQGKHGATSQVAPVPSDDHVKLQALHVQLQDKINLIKDMLVARSELLVGVADNPMVDPGQVPPYTHGRGSDGQHLSSIWTSETIKSLEQQYDRASQQVYALALEVCDYEFVDVGVLQTHQNRTQSGDSSGNLDFTRDTIFDNGIAFLAKDLENMQTLSNNILAHIKQSIKNETAAASVPLPTVSQDDRADGIDVSDMKLQSLATFVAAEEATEASLSGEYGAHLARVKNLEMKILATERDWAQKDAELRLKQSVVALHALSQKEDAVEVCNRTIVRLQSDLGTLRDANEHLERTQPRQLAPSPRRSPTNRYNLPLENTQANRISPRHAPPGSHSNKISSPRGSAELVSLVDSDGARLKAVRKKLFEELLHGERHFVKELNVLMEVFLLPMRRKGLLPPREMQYVMGNISTILNLNQALLVGLEGKRNATVALNTFARHVNDFDAYVKYINGLANGIATLSARRFENKELYEFLLNASEREECNGRDVVSYMIQPVHRLLRYVMVFEKLDQLSTPDQNPEHHRLVLQIIQELQVVSSRMEAAKESLDNDTQVLTLFHRMVPSRDCDRSLFNHVVRQFAEQAVHITKDVHVLPPASQTFFEFQVHVLNDVLVFTRTPKNWSPTFTDELPKLVTVYLLSCKQIDVQHESTTESHKNNVIVRYADTQGDPVHGVRSPRRDHDEFILKCTTAQEARQLRDVILERIDHAFVAPSKPSSPRKASSPNKVPSPRKSPTNRALTTRDLEKPDNISFFPGTNMIERRKLAQDIGATRGCWSAIKPSNKLNPRFVSIENTRFEEMDDWQATNNFITSLRSPTRDDDAPALTKTTTISPWARVDNPHKFPNSAGKAKTHKVAFGSTIHESPRLGETPKRSHKPQMSRTQPVTRHESDSDCFDVDSPYNPNFMENLARSSNSLSRPGSPTNRKLNFSMQSSTRTPNKAERRPNPEPRKVSLSIFKSPKPKGSVFHAQTRKPSHGQRDRFIGLTWQESEYVKQRNRFEETW